MGMEAEDKLKNEMEKNRDLKNTNEDQMFEHNIEKVDKKNGDISTKGSEPIVEREMEVCKEDSDKDAEILALKKELEDKKLLTEREIKLTEEVKELKTLILLSED